MITLDDLLKENKKRAKFTEDLERREDALKYLDFYNNDQYDHTYDHMSEIYPNTIGDIAKYIKQKYVTRRVVDIMSLMFQQEPEITVEGIGEKQQEALNELLHRIGLFSKLDMTQKLANNYLKTAIFPKWDEKRKETYLEVITPDDMVAIQDSKRPLMLDGLLINFGLVEDTPFIAERINRYLYITDDEWNTVLFDAYSGTLTTEETSKNPYSAITPTFFQLYPTIKSFWGDVKNDIVQTNLYINEYMTNAAIILHYQTFSTLVRTGNATWLDAHPIKFGPQYTIDIGRDEMSGESHADAKYITPQTQLEKINEHIRQEILDLATSHNISASAYRSDNQSARSGYSIRLDRADLIMKNMQQQQYFEAPIERLVKMIMLTEQMNPEGINFGNNIMNTRVTVKFGEINIDEDPEIEIEIAQKKIESNIASAVDYIMLDNPELTEEEAIEKYNNNIALKQGRSAADETELDEILELGE